MKDGNEIIWWSRFRELEKFAAKHGHARPTARQNSSLESWVRRQENSDSLTKKQRESLEAIGAFNKIDRRGEHTRRDDVKTEDIIALLNKGFSYSEIASNFNMSSTGVQNRLRKEGLIS